MMKVLKWTGAKMKVAVIAAALLPALAWAGQWDYSVLDDKMSGRKTTLAILESDNSLALDFPYAGQNFGRLMIRHHPKHGTHAIVAVDKGQILCSLGMACRILVKFDGMPPKRFKGIPPDDHSTTSVALAPAGEFIEAATKAKRIMVQLQMFQAGEPILEFSTPSGLTWKPAK